VAGPLIDEQTEFGARAARHLRDDVVVWLTTVAHSGAPLPSPVWFVWDGEDAVTLHSIDGARVRNITENSRVSLNFPGNAEGGDIVVLAGTAAADSAAPPADRDAPYLAKYADHITRIGMTPESFAARYSVPVRILLTGLRGH
jgi:PPOX class probable F420-dependent enzyme